MTCRGRAHALRRMCPGKITGRPLKRSSFVPKCSAFAVGERRMPLSTTAQPGRYHCSSDNVYFFMNSGDRRVRCAVTFRALGTFEPKLKRGDPTQVACFDANRDRIERAASAKFDLQYLQRDGTVLVMAED